LLGNKAKRAAPVPESEQVDDDSVDRFAPAADACTSASEAFDQWLTEIRRQEEAEEERLARARLWEAQGGWCSAETGGRVGLMNIKNTCWLNAVVQSLAQLPPFTAQFLTVERGAGRPSTAADLLIAASKRSKDEGSKIGGKLRAGRPVAQSCAVHEDSVTTSGGARSSSSGVKGGGSNERNPKVRERSASNNFKHLQEDQAKILNSCQEAASKDSSGGDCIEPVISTQLKELLEMMWKQKQPNPISPWRFHLSLTANRPSFEARRPQDAQEFFVFLVDALHEELVAVQRQNEQSPSESPIQDLFQSEIQSTLRCKACGHTSSTREKQPYLSVPVPERAFNEHLTLEEGFSLLACEEHLSGSNQWHCDACNQRVEATKRTTLHRLPPLLVVHLTRLAYCTKTFKLRKVRTRVTLPDSHHDGIDLSRFTTPAAASSLHQSFAASTAACPSPTSEHDSTTDATPIATDSESEPLVYDIVSVVNHHGREAMCGHYTANCRHCVDGKWYQYDDTRVKSIESSDGLNPTCNSSPWWMPAEAYMICLLQRGWHSPFGPS